MFTILWFWLAHVRPTNTVEELIHLQIATCLSWGSPSWSQAVGKLNENHVCNTADADLARDFWKYWWRHPKKVNTYGPGNVLLSGLWSLLEIEKNHPDIFYTPVIQHSCLENWTTYKCVQRVPLWNTSSFPPKQAIRFPQRIHSSLTHPFTRSTVNYLTTTASNPLLQLMEEILYQLIGTFIPSFTRVVYI